MDRFPFKTVLIIFLSIVGIIALSQTTDVVSVSGDEVCVVETWDGISPEIRTSGTHFLIPGWTQKPFIYNVGQKVYRMSDQGGDEEDGEHNGAYLVTSSDNQPMHISFRVNYSLDPNRIIDIHKTIRTVGEEPILRQTLLRVVKDEATSRTSIQAYSGEGLVKLQQDIEKDLTSPDNDLAKLGFNVTGFVIENISLEKEFTTEIRNRQIATQKQLRLVEERKAADEEAKVAEAKAKADYNTQVVQAERDAKKRVLAAEADKEQTRLAAEAERLKRVEEATGLRDAEVLRAEGIRAVGEAEAMALQAKYSAWALPGAETFTKVAVAESFANSSQNIMGYLPQGMTMNIIAENFLDGLSRFQTANIVTADKKPAIKTELPEPKN